MSRNVVIGLVVVLALFLGGWFIFNSKQTPPATQTTPTSTELAQPVATGTAVIDEESKAMVINITSGGYSPKDLVVKAGQSVLWFNKDSKEHTVDSAPHPTHTIYPKLNLGVIKTGESKTLIFSDKGTYKYHDHLNPTLFGSITVE